jgi:hypothetical protein
MCTEEAIKNKSATTRIELVDNWHARWSSVVQSLAQDGQQKALKVDDDGWLSARQVLLVAFTDDEVTGHLSFAIAPTSRLKGHVEIKAEVDSFGVKPGFGQCEVEHLLREAAQTRAQELNCRELVWQ